MLSSVDRRFPVTSKLQKQGHRSQIRQLRGDFVRADKAKSQIKQRAFISDCKKSAKGERVGSGLAAELLASLLHALSMTPPLLP